MTADGTMTRRRHGRHRCTCGGEACRTCGLNRELLQAQPTFVHTLHHLEAKALANARPRTTGARKSKSRFIKAQEAASKVVQVSKFFELPGEIRNQIYDFATEEAEYEIRWLSRPRKSLTSWKVKPTQLHLSWKSRVESSKVDDVYDKSNVHEWTLAHRIGSDLRKKYNKGVDNMEINLTGPAAWLSTCRMMHDEGGQFFYSKIKFGFRGRVLLDEFTRRLPPPFAQSVPELFIHHVIHGEPELRAHQFLKERDDERWARTCENASKAFTGLTRLNMVLHLNGIRASLVPRAPAWALPLHQFSKSGVQTFEFILVANHGNYTDREVRRAVQFVRRKVLGGNYSRPPPRHHARVLRITST